MVLIFASHLQEPYPVSLIIFEIFLKYTQHPYGLELLLNDNDFVSDISIICHLLRVTSLNRIIISLMHYRELQINY